MVELVITILLIGILAVFTIPRFVGVSVFETRGYFDSVANALRHAHKTAIAQRRAVYAKLDTSTGQVSLCFANHATAACVSNVPRPTGETSYVVTAPSGVTLAISPAPANNTLFFDSLGRPYASSDAVPSDTSSASTFSTLTATITGGDSTYSFAIEQGSGYVRH